MEAIITKKNTNIFNIKKRKLYRCDQEVKNYRYKSNMNTKESNQKHK